MTTETKSENVDTWKMKALVVGGVIGALVGLGAAYLLVQQSESVGQKPEVRPGDGVMLGLTVLGLLRQVVALGDKS